MSCAICEQPIRFDDEYRPIVASIAGEAGHKLCHKVLVPRPLRAVKKSSWIGFPRLIMRDLDPTPDYPSDLACVLTIHLPVI